MQSLLDFAGHLKAFIVRAMGSQCRVLRTKEVDSLELSMGLQRAQDFLWTCSVATESGGGLVTRKSRRSSRGRALKVGRTSGSEYPRNHAPCQFRNGFENVDETHENIARQSREVLCKSRKVLAFILDRWPELLISAML